jgi:spermidine/putrescine-binding protein
VVHYYNRANYIGPDTIPAFEAATGIKVIYDAYDAEETLEALILMGDTGYDVVGASMATFAPGIAAGTFMPLDRTQLPTGAISTRTRSPCLASSTPATGMQCLTCTRSTAFPATST